MMPSIDQQSIDKKGLLTDYRTKKWPNQFRAFYIKISIAPFFEGHLIEMSGPHYQTLDFWQYF
jgi:hypothetical protein